MICFLSQSPPDKGDLGGFFLSKSLIRVFFCLGVSSIGGFFLSKSLIRGFLPLQVPLIRGIWGGFFAGVVSYTKVYASCY